MTSRLEDVLHVLELSLVQLPEHLLVQDLGEADDRVQRRPQLVRHIRQELALMPADRLEIVVQASQLVVHTVHVGCERAELVPVRYVEVTRKVALGDTGEPCFGVLNRANERPRENQAEHECQRNAARTDSDEEIPGR